MQSSELFIFLSSLFSVCHIFVFRFVCFCCCWLLLLLPFGILIRAHIRIALLPHNKVNGSTTNTCLTLRSTVRYSTDSNGQRTNQLNAIRWPAEISAAAAVNVRVRVFVSSCIKTKSTQMNVRAHRTHTHSNVC